jgi:hypothetical protein
MRLSKLALISSLLVGCGGLPNKPVVNLCILDYARQQLSCTSTGATPVSIRIPLEAGENYTCISPDDWAAIQNYINALSQAVQGQ